jgi:hypothetical protein
VSTPDVGELIPSSKHSAFHHEVLSSAVAWTPDLGECIMIKSLIRAVVVASSLAAPALALAQANTPLTRAQVNAELVELKRVGGLRATGQDNSYPRDIQAAQARIAAEKAATTGLGGAIGGSAESGGPAPVRPSVAENNGLPPIFFGS